MTPGRKKKPHTNWTKEKEKGNKLNKNYSLTTPAKQTGRCQSSDTSLLQDVRNVRSLPITFYVLPTCYLRVTISITLLTLYYTFMFVRDRRERIFPCHVDGIRTPIRTYGLQACRQFDYEVLYFFRSSVVKH